VCLSCTTNGVCVGQDEELLRRVDRLQTPIDQGIRAIDLSATRLGLIGLIVLRVQKNRPDRRSIGSKSS
jgi:hypothetical protein